MFTLTLSMNDVKKMVMKEFGYQPEDLEAVSIQYKEEYGVPYIQIVDKNKTINQLGIPEDNSLVIYDEYNK